MSHTHAWFARVPHVLTFTQAAAQVHTQTACVWAKAKGASASQSLGGMGRVTRRRHGTGDTTEGGRHGTGDTTEGGREGGGRGASGCWGFSLRNKNANPLYSPVDRLDVKQVRVPRSTCVPSIYQLAFLCPALFICSSLNAVAWMSSHIFRRTLLMTMTVLASVLHPHTALMMPPQAERQREPWTRHCPN